MNAELKRLIKNLGELAKIAEDMEQIKTVDQAVAEAEARLQAARREAESVTA